MTDYAITAPGYPRVGPERAYKTLLEGYWSGETAEGEFAAKARALQAERLRTQAEAGLDLVPCGDFSLYDHVLDAAIALGCIPARFDAWREQGGRALYFAMARGRDGVPPCEMTKWFDTNYHYLVPELPARFERIGAPARDAYRLGREIAGTKAKPVLLGPFTFLKLARAEGADLAARLEELTPLYAEILGELVREGAALIQMDEPALAGDVSDAEWAAFVRCYEALGRQRSVAVAAPGRSGSLPNNGEALPHYWGQGATIGGRLLIQTYYGDVRERFAALCALPVAGLGLDFVRGRAGNLAAIRERGFPEELILAAGVADGRNVWRADLNDAFGLARELAGLVAPDRLQLGASCSLLHLPETAESETHLPAALKGGLCFARERLAELNLLARALRDGKESVRDAWDEAERLRREWLEFEARHREGVRQRIAALSEDDFRRIPYAERLPLQRRKLFLPPLPTTTIGSFPQTTDLRQARARAAKDPAGYKAVVDAEIARVVRLQEEIGLDVLVHGEPERNDMVQFFAERLTGFAATRQGWVQSYGSRCVRPPLLYGDVERLAPMTVEEAALAQSLTKRPVKGMLTGPITILQWSFVREDVPRETVANQIALAIRDETRDLETNVGLKIVQVDEPAIREGLPLRRAGWPEYLRWAVRAFRLATSGVSADIQVHTHMCYSEFGEIIAAIAAMDADVISIEDARSDGAMLETLRDFRYPQQIGPGVYDIHSPNVPTVNAIAGKLAETLKRLPAEQVWVNPDCGLKTRGYAEVVPALENMVAAARQARKRLLQTP